MASGWLWIGVWWVCWLGCVAFALRLGLLITGLECCGCCIRFARVFLVLWWLLLLCCFCDCALWISLVACV